MKLRCDLHVNGGERKLVLIAGPNEPDEHLPLKLAGYLLFWDLDPIISATAKLPALAAFDFLPDIVALDTAGDISLWVECGSTTMNKLLKLTRRVPEGRGRIIVLKESRREAERLRKDVESHLDRPARIEILHFPDGAFRAWVDAVGDSAELYGEASEQLINGVVNENSVLVELGRC